MTRLMATNTLIGNNIMATELMIEASYKDRIKDSIGLPLQEMLSYTILLCSSY